MPRYIDADKLKQHYSWWREEERVVLNHIVDQQPTADVRENVRGEWLSGDCMGASCSKCGEYFSFRTFSEVHNFNFCPNCGADMRGES